MRGFSLLCAVALTLPVAAAAQTPRDSTARADSIARADSLALVRELEALERSDTTAVTPVRGAINPRLLPDISVVGDLIGDFSPKGSTQEGGERLLVREVELAFQAAVDPYFRGDVFIGFSDEEGAAVEQAFITTTAPPVACRSSTSSRSSPGCRCAG